MHEYEAGIDDISDSSFSCSNYCNSYSSPWNWFG